MDIQTDFDITKCLKRLGFQEIDKSQELLAVKGNINIYYYHDNILPPLGGCPIGMVIKCENDTIYKGIIPQSEQFLTDLLDSLFPNSELLNEIDGKNHKKFIE